VLALDFRGYGKSRGAGQSDPMSAPLELDVLAAVAIREGRGRRASFSIATGVVAHDSTMSEMAIFKLQ